MRPRDFLILVFVCLVWGYSNVLSKTVVGTWGVPPLFFAAVRFAALPPDAKSRSVTYSGVPKRSMAHSRMSTSSPYEHGLTRSPIGSSTRSPEPVKRTRSQQGIVSHNSRASSACSSFS